MRADNSLLAKGFYEFGDFRLNVEERVLESAGRPVPLAPKALEVLIALIENRGHIVEKDELMKKVWPGTFVEENSLAFNVSVLRKVLREDSTSRHYIETVPKRGYRFIAKVIEVSAPDLSPPIAPPPLSTPRRPVRRLVVVPALLTLTVVGLLTYLLPANPKLTDRDTIVLADFVNKTGDPVFDGTLYQGLTVQLEQSPFLSLISERRVRQTLRLMGQPPDARVTPDLARGICERTGSVAVLEGSIASLGSQYVLGLRARNCRTGDVLDNQQLQIARKEEVLNALSQIARGFRSRVGESRSSITRHDTPIAEATTGSFEALQAYSEAYKVTASRGATASLPLFRRAAELDPEFAMAHAWVGRVYANLDQSDLAAESVRRAWQLRDRTSDREKFFITANYQQLVTGNLEEARQTGEAWAQTYPRDAAPHMLLSGSVNKTPGRYEQVSSEAGKAIELDPGFAVGYYNLAVAAAYMNRFAEAEDILRHAAATGLEIQESLMLDYDLAFMKNDSVGMERVSARARARTGPRSWVSNKEAFALAYSGRLQQAQSMSRRAVAESQHEGQRERAGVWEAGAAVRLALFGNLSEARKTAATALELSRDREVSYGAAFALALSGDDSRSLEIADALESRFPEDSSIRFSYLPVLHARLALNQGEPAQAINLLQTAAPFELGTPRSSLNALFGALYPVYTRGEAYLALHQSAQAASEFQKILDHRGIVVSDPIGALARLQLGRAFALSGNRIKAKTAYEDFLTLWKDADANIPIVQQAKAEYSKLQ
ncbi:MAG: winged helix-turn-helix domain-containing protein [Acidobacteriota bacterium]|nr:winged helix-turn-helix domain-containing protein [Acidobacteriota bacterium]